MINMNNIFKNTSQKCFQLSTFCKCHWLFFSVIQENVVFFLKFIKQMIFLMVFKHNNLKQLQKLSLNCHVNIDQYKQNIGHIVLFLFSFLNWQQVWIGTQFFFIFLILTTKFNLFGVNIQVKYVIGCFLCMFIFSAFNISILRNGIRMYAELNIKLISRKFYRSFYSFDLIQLILIAILYFNLLLLTNQMFE